MNTRKAVPPGLKWTIATEQEFRCAHCSALLAATCEVDHIKPIHSGGHNERENLQILCLDCHGFKSRREMEKRTEERRRLKLHEISLECQIDHLIAHMADLREERDEAETKYAALQTNFISLQERYRLLEGPAINQKPHLSRRDELRMMLQLADPIIRAPLLRTKIRVLLFLW